MTQASLLTRLRPVMPAILMIAGLVLICCSALLLGIYVGGPLLGAVFATFTTGVACLIVEWLLRDDRGASAP